MKCYYAYQNGETPLHYACKEDKLSLVQVLCATGKLNLTTPNNVCMCVCMCMCMYRVHVRMCMSVCTCMYVCICTQLW